MTELLRQIDLGRSIDLDTLIVIDLSRIDCTKIIIDVMIITIIIEEWSGKIIIEESELL